MSAPTKRTRVGRACDRCRRQKLRCDIQRPCTLCVHAGIECQTGVGDQFKPYQSPSRNIQRKRPRRQSALDRDDEPELNSRTADQRWSSSTMSLVAGAFQLHNAVTPDSLITTAMPGGQEPVATQISAVVNTPERRHHAIQPSLINSRQQGSQPAAADLVSLLPSREVAALLIDTYFDRVHWFMLIFHQEPSREKWKSFYERSPETLGSANPNIGVISTFLMVIAIGLQYTGQHRQQTLRDLNVDPETMKQNILSVIRSKLLDIVSSNSIEAVQTCVLLGTYYLYHGSPNLAWPVCGCGLRVAQALNLHHKLPISGPISQDLQQHIETRKRCWWAIYEIETFCSMSYGYPHGIVDDDCSVELLNPLAMSAGQSPGEYNEPHKCPATLLSYKYLMSKLSILLKDVLTDIYKVGSRRAGSRNNQGSPMDCKELMEKVPLLDDRLKKWKAEIPHPLHLNEFSGVNYASAEEMDRDVGASGSVFEGHIYQLQALALALAYENARILVHRPLMAYRANLYHSEIPRSSSDASEHTSSLSLRTCRSAAMSTSQMGESPIFSLAAETYAAAFISIHTFTAGVTLCVLASVQPLSPESQESKLGLRRLLHMQAQLKSKSKSALSGQGFDILERLVRLVMEKELSELLGSGSKGSLQDEPRESQPQENWQRLSQSLLDAQLGQSTDTTSTYEDVIPNIVEDTDISQALIDLENVISGPELDGSFDPILADLLNESSNHFTQEQAWIWGMDTPAQFNEH